MATSGTVVYTMTAEEFVTTALQRIGVVAEGETATAAQYATGERELNLILKTMQMQGYGLMRRAEQTVSLTDATTTPTGTYTLATRPASVINVRFAIDGVERRPLAEWSREDFDASPIKSTTGSPVVYVVDRQRTATSLRFWPIPDEPASETWTAVVSYERVPETVTGPTEEVDIAQEQHDAVIDVLAAALIPHFGMAVSESAAQIVLARAGVKAETALNWDRRGMIRFTTVGRQ